MELRELLTKSFIVASNLNKKLIMHKLGHYDNDKRLKNIIASHLEIRKCFDHSEVDIADFNWRIGLRGK